MKPATVPEPDLLYWLIHGAPRWLWRLFGTARALGQENIPEAGPFLLIANHQSVMDPLLIQSLCPRPMHAMAKSTQFRTPVIGAIMSHCYGFPVRRFQVDPQAVRVTLRRLAAGYPVAIYIEGERTWDGRLQQPRAGTVRTALKAGSPILPCAIAGAYDVWPRWDRSFQRGRICVSFGTPFRLPKLNRRADREAALPGATTTIISAIRAELDRAHAWLESPSAERH
ncbi:MAG: 1-acyl-sn-glycerol-3-phosphate acyltransferase [Gemmatimonadetes bacterium]|nr:1-acyl-sn-glycerol-3-phosphate acyltransferase [Gemmatimonadota bacterium]